MAYDHDNLQKPQKAAKISLSASMPTELMEEIMVRLPVKSILRFRAVSKQWLSLISHPSFVELHFARSRYKSLHTSLLITSYDYTSGKQHFLSTAPHNGGPVMVLSTDCCIPMGSEPQHLNGLVLYTCNGFHKTDFPPYVLNPSTHKCYELTVPYCTCDHVYDFYFFGFDESINKHKILNIRVFEDSPAEFMMYSFSNYSWRKIYVKTLPVDHITGMYSWRHIPVSVCINSVIHMKIDIFDEILAFDLKTETFSVINLPSKLDWDGNVTQPFLMNINGLLGVLCFPNKGKELHIWILQDREDCIWVRKYVPLSEPWHRLGHCPYTVGSTNNLEEIVFPNMYWDQHPIMLTLDVYDVKTECINKVELEFNLGDEFLHSHSKVLFTRVISYVESMFPLGEK